MTSHRDAPTRTTRGAFAVLGYIASIFVANWLITHFGLVPVGFGLKAPAGVYVAGLAFILRDVVQDDLGIGWVIYAILAGATVSLTLSAHFAIASGAAFLVSELADFAVYTPLRRRSWAAAAVFSNTVGDLVDSALFLWLAFGSLANVAGLVLGKWYVTLPVVVIFGVRHLRERHAVYRNERSHA